MKFEVGKSLKFKLSQFDWNQNDTSKEFTNYCMTRDSFVKRFKEMFLGDDSTSSSSSSIIPFCMSDTNDHDDSDEGENITKGKCKKRKNERDNTIEASVPVLKKPTLPISDVEKECESNVSFYLRLEENGHFLKGKII